MMIAVFFIFWKASRLIIPRVSGVRLQQTRTKSDCWRSSSCDTAKQMLNFLSCYWQSNYTILLLQFHQLRFMPRNKTLIKNLTKLCWQSLRFWFGVVPTVQKPPNSKWFEPLTYGLTYTAIANDAYSAACQAWSTHPEG